jgi:hypothetical protein
MIPRLRAGVGQVELGPALGLPMMGYGARRGVARATHDPLFARALYLAGAGPEDRLLIVELDLCLIAVAQANSVRARVSRGTGLRPEQVVVGCIHTHSGPVTGMAELVAGDPVPDHVAPLLDAAVEAAVRAADGAVPARLGAGLTEAHIGRNRRLAGGSADPSVTVLRIDRMDGAPLAVAYLHGCHPTVLGHDNLLYSADWPGAAASAIAEALPGAVAFFALGAHADVDPRTRGRQDLAVEGRSRGAGFDEVEALGREMAAEVAAYAARLDTDSDAPIGIATGRVRLPIHGAARGEDQREERLAQRRADALSALDLPPDAAPSTRDLYRLEHERTRGLPVDEVRERIARVRLYLRDRSAARIAGGRSAEVEAQVLRVGPLRWLALPLEVCADVGLDWRRRLGDELASVLSIANGWLRYLPHEASFAEPGAHLAYEVLQSTFEPSASRSLLDLGEELAAQTQREWGRC